MPKLLILHADKVRKWSLQEKLKDGQSLMNCRGKCEVDWKFFCILNISIC
jgi:hypothetical protein